jgi:hypothetical protein
VKASCGIIHNDLDASTFRQFPKRRNEPLSRFRNCENPQLTIRAAFTF